MLTMNELDLLGRFIDQLVRENRGTHGSPSFTLPEILTLNQLQKKLRQMRLGLDSSDIATTERKNENGQ